jgi:hypothetical protein
LFCTVFLISGMALPQTAEGLTSYIDEHNRFILNEAPFFPLGLYVIQPLAGQDLLDELAEITAADSHFDTLLNYNINNGNDVDIHSYLDVLQSSNLKLIYALNEYIPYDRESELCGDIDIDSIAAKVGNPDITDHDAVISWYLNDEVGSHNAAAQADCLAQLEAGYEKIKELDGNHAVWSVHWNPAWLRPEAHTTDILGMDSYPIDHKANPMGEVIGVADAAAAVGSDPLINKPFWLVPQIFDWNDYRETLQPGDDRLNATRPPNKAEMRAMTYLAVNHGAKGLIYYSYFDIRDDADYDTRWPQIKEIASEIDWLRSVFLSTYQTSGNQISCDNADIDFKLMWEGNTYYLLAVNTEVNSLGQSVENNGVLFQINLANKPAAFDILFEDPSIPIPVSSGTVTDNFGPYEVHVYHWQGSFEEKADFTADNTSGTQPLAIQFSDQSTRTIETAWAWNFGDGVTSTAQHPSHTYNNAGDFTVSLTVTGLGGSDTETKTAYIHVEPAPVSNTGGGGCFIGAAAPGSYVDSPF